MGMFGYYKQKMELATQLSNLLTSYFFASFRPNYLEFKIIFEIIDKDYFKIINKASNIGSPTTQHQYKNLMVDVFTYMLPKNSFKVIEEKNKFIKVYHIDPDIIMRNFKNVLLYEKKTAKYKDIHTFSGKMNYNEFKKYILDLLNVDPSDNIDIIELLEESPKQRLSQNL